MFPDDAQPRNHIIDGLQRHILLGTAFIESEGLSRSLIKSPRNRNRKVITPTKKSDS